MELKRLEGDFAVCKLESAVGVDLNKEFVFFARTDEEISLVCKTDSIPENTTDVETGWKALKICGMLDFGLVGVIAKISALLAENAVPVFVISTYNTDYILFKKAHEQKAVDALKKADYTLS